MHLALAGNAKVLVSGDKDLLAIAAEFEQASNSPILTLDAFFRHPLGLQLLQNL
jgi:predicted nucleic acid-binding protein